MKSAVQPIFQIPPHTTTKDNTMTTPTRDQIRTALNGMTDEERANWVERLRKAAANLDNAAYGLAGNVPDAQPDPLTWSLMWLELGSDQLKMALDDVVKRAKDAEVNA